MVAIRNRTTLDASHQLRRENSEYYLKSPEEMAVALRRVAGGARQQRPHRRALHLRPHARPRTIASPTTRCPTGETRRLPPASASATRPPASATAASRRRSTPACSEELALVRKHGLSGFFLVYRDLLELAREEAAKVRGSSPRALAGLPPGRGRGSSVGSLICYLIGLSHVDPLQLQPLLRPLPQRRDGLGAGHRPRLRARHPREAHPARLRALRAGARGAGRRASPPTACAPPSATWARRWACRRRSWTSWRSGSERAPRRRPAGGDGALPGVPPTRPTPRSGATWWSWRRRSTASRATSRSTSAAWSSPRSRSWSWCPSRRAAWTAASSASGTRTRVDDARMIKIDFLALGMLSLVEECLDLIAEQPRPLRRPQPHRLRRRRRLRHDLRRRHHRRLPDREPRPDADSCRARGRARWRT